MSSTFKISGPIKIGSLSSAPANPEVGYMYYDTTAGKYQQYDGSSFVEPADLDVLASTANGEGASLVGIEDSASQFTSTNVEGALDESLDAAQAAQSTADGAATAASTADGKAVAAQSDIDAHKDGGASKHDASEVDYERVDGSKKNIQAASDSVEPALTDLDDAIGALAATPSNYTPTDAGIVADHLAGIDSALTTAGGSVFADDEFLVTGSVDATKKIALEADNIASGTTRTIAMPDEDIDLGDMASKTALASTGGAALVGILDTAADYTATDVEGALAEVKALADTAIQSSEKGANSGVATLDGGGKVPVAQLPNSVMQYQGVFDPSTATFTDAGGNAGDVYSANAAGSYDAGSGSITYAVGDWAVHNGSIFEKSLNSDSVASVNGQTGVVVLDADDLSDAATTNKFATSAQLAKVDHLTVTQAVDLDTMESDTATNNAKVSADGLVTTHSDVTSAGSGAIITVGERALVASAMQDLSDDTTPSLGGDLALGANVVIHDGDGMKRGLSASAFVEEEYIEASLLASQTDTVISALTFAHASFAGMELTFTVKEATSGDLELGTIRIATDGTVVALNQVSTETAPTGVSFSAAVNGLNIEVKYSSGANAATLKCDAKRIQA